MAAVVCGLFPIPPNTLCAISLILLQNTAQSTMMAINATPPAIDPTIIPIFDLGFGLMVQSFFA